MNFSSIYLQVDPNQPLQWPIYVAGPIIILLFLIIIADGFGGPVVNTLVGAWENLFHSLTNRSFRIYPQAPKEILPADKRQFLFDQLHFYKQLSTIQRNSFDNRTIRFMRTRVFEGREGAEITEDMQLLISAIAVQITFGLRSYMMREFTKILVYPRAYYNKMSKRYHKGEVNPNGIVVLSWEDFYEGIRIPDDDLNLGLHEFAHVLSLQRLNNRAFKDRFFAAAFDKLIGNVSNAMFRSAIQRRLKLREYALTNPMEFFAVATEAFFENPIEMYKNNHIMYSLFEQMYNQNLLDLYQRPVQPLTK